MKWSKEEEQALQLLIATLGKGDWEKIAKQFNFLFPESKKTLQQFRNKYQGIYQVNKRTEQNQGWTSQQQILLRTLYIEKGSKWSSFLSSLPNKTIKSIKNKFYNKLRVFSKKFITYQTQNNGCRNPLTYQNVVVFLQLCMKIQKWMNNNNYKRNPNSLIFNCRDSLLNLIFEVQKIEESSSVNEIIQYLKHMNRQLKFLGIFKSKYRKAWDINNERVKFILQIDSIIQNQEQIFKSWFSMMSKENNINQDANKVEQPKLIKQELFDQIANFLEVKNEFFENQPKAEEIQHNFNCSAAYIYPLIIYHW